MKKVFLPFICLLLSMPMTSSLYAAKKVKEVEEITILSTEGKINSKKAAFAGRVICENEDVLPGALVYITNLSTGAVTDAQGYFYVSNIPAGEHTVEVTYMGYKTVTKKLTFKESQLIESEIRIVSQDLKADDVTVVGIVSGRRKAVQQQHSAEGVSNIISADQMERFPDENIGDAMKRIPGVNVQYDQGEARFGQVRGTSPSLTAVTVNGNRTPSAEGGTRAAQLDLIPADMVQTIEVRKVVTADMDGDAIGGAVNLVTKSAPSREMFNATAGLGYNPISNKITYNGGFTLGKRFLDDKLGVVAAVSYMNNAAGSDNIEGEWAIDENDGSEYLAEFENRQYFVQRERQSYSLSSDYRFDANNKLEFKAMYNRRNDWENRYKLKIKSMDLFDDDGNRTGKVSRETKGGTEDEKYTRLEQQETQSYNLAGQHKISRLSIDWNVDYSTASELRPNERYIGYEAKNVALTQDISNQRTPSVTPLSADGFDIENMGFDVVEESNQVIREKELKASLNFKYDINNGKFANALRFGYKVQSKDKFCDIDYYLYEPTDSYESTFESEAISNIIDQTRDNFMVGNYKIGSFVDREYLGNLNLSDASLFESEENYTEEASNYKGTEVINAAYLRFDQKFGNKLSAVAGVRVENTDYNYTRELSDGYEGNLDITGTDNLTNKRSTLNVLPSILFKYTPNDKFVGRASFTSTISRPDFEALIPGKVYDTNEEEIYEGNPDIKNMISNNVDFMVEYYTGDAGLLSAGVYYKDIHDFIVEATDKEEYNGDSYKRSKYINAGNGYILGLEFALQHDLSFLGSALKDFGIYANYTYNHSKVTELADDTMLDGQVADDLSLPGTPKHIANFSLYYETNKFSAAIAYNFASAYLDEMGDTAFENRYYDKTNYLDFNLSVRANKWLTVFGEVTNLLNQPLRYYQGEEQRTMQVEYYGLRTNVGLKVRF